MINNYGIADKCPNWFMRSSTRADIYEGWVQRHPETWGIEKNIPEWNKQKIVVFWCDVANRSPSMKRILILMVERASHNGHFCYPKTKLQSMILNPWCLSQRPTQKVPCGNVRQRMYLHWYVGYSVLALNALCMVRSFLWGLERWNTVYYELKPALIVSDIRRVRMRWAKHGGLHTVLGSSSVS